MTLESTKEYKESIEKERGAYALEKAKKIENRRYKKGWRFVKVDNKFSVFVPCDKHGNPTEEGQRIINQVVNR